MDKENIFKVLVKELKNLVEDDYEFTEDTVLAEASLTSIGFVKLLIFAEDQFNIVFSDDDLLMSNDITLKDLIDKISDLQN